MGDAAEAKRGHTLLILGADHDGVGAPLVSRDGQSLGRFQLQRPPSGTIQMRGRHPTSELVVGVRVELGARVRRLFGTPSRVGLDHFEVALEQADQLAGPGGDSFRAESAGGAEQGPGHDDPSARRRPFAEGRDAGAGLMPSSSERRTCRKRSADVNAARSGCDRTR